MLTPEQEALKQAALEAGSESWTSMGALAFVFGEDGDSVCLCHTNIGHMPEPLDAHARAAFIAKANPAAILAILAQLEAAQEVQPVNPVLDSMVEWSRGYAKERGAKRFTVAGVIHDTYPAATPPAIAEVATPKEAALQALVDQAQKLNMGYGAPDYGASINAPYLDAEKAAARITNSAQHDERSAFENYIADKYPNMPLNFQTQFDGVIVYKSAGTQHRWSGWKARAALQQPAQAVPDGWIDLIEWMLGKKGPFPTRNSSNEGLYWWRKELRARYEKLAGAAPGEPGQ